MRTTEPTTIAQGERIEWTRSFTPDYPATLYTLSYRFRGLGRGVNVAAVASGSEFVTEITAAVSTALAAMSYRWQAWLTEIADSTNTFIIDSGSIVVEAGFSTNPAAIDLRSPAKKALDSIDAAMTAFTTSNVLEYEITTPAGSRRVKRSASSELMNLRKHYAIIVAREIWAEKGQISKSVKVRMFQT